MEIYPVDNVIHLLNNGGLVLPANMWFRDTSCRCMACSQTHYFLLKVRRVCVIEIKTAGN